MKFKFLPLAFLALLTLFSCGNNAKKDKTTETVQADSTPVATTEFDYVVDTFADIEVMRYQIPGWNKLTLKEKKLVYYLTQAGLAGRDILWDQFYEYNLEIRHALEQIYTQYEGDKNTEDWKNFVTYLKQVWFANGIHHHYSNDKFVPKFDKSYLKELLSATNTTLQEDALNAIFNDEDLKKVNLDKSKGLIKGSAVNFYGNNITAEEVDEFYHQKESPNPKKPLAFGLNSKLVKVDGQLQDKVWKSGGMYGQAIDSIIFWLDKAKQVAEDEQQAKALGLLIEFYQTGDLQTWDDYSVAWVKDTAGIIDYINGFIEVYNDPKGYKGTYESVVQIKDFDMTKKMKIIGNHAQWFEDHSPIMDEFKKKNVVGVTYNVVNVAGEAGAASPSTPIGINLPNSNWIREHVGSKSVSLGNIITAYNNAGGGQILEEFAYDEEQIRLAKKYGELADKIHTALHEVVGHASGRLADGVAAPKKTLKSYASTIEEGRADLVGLYYLMDPIMEEMGFTDDYKKLGKAAYNGYIRNGLMTQLIRIELGDDIEEAHMRNRHWISQWAYEKGKKDSVIVKKVEDGKTYFVIQDYEKLRDLFGQLLREVQRIKSQGDYEAAKQLVETYGVKVDPELHKEVLERNAPIATPPYGGFVNPVLVPVKNDEGEIVDIKVTQPDSFAEQMLNYSKKYNNLPVN